MGITLALFGTLVLVWCAAVVLRSDEWGESIEAWHLLAVGSAAAIVATAGIRGARGQAALLLVGCALAVVTFLGVVWVLSADH